MPNFVPFVSEIVPYHDVSSSYSIVLSRILLRSRNPFCTTVLALSTVTERSSIASAFSGRNTAYKPGVAGSIPAPPTNEIKGFFVGKPQIRLTANQFANHFADFGVR